MPKRIHHVLDVNESKDGREFLIKWYRLGEKHNSWILETEVEDDQRHFIDEFLAEQEAPPTPTRKSTRTKRKVTSTPLKEAVSTKKKKVPSEKKTSTKRTRSRSATPKRNNKKADTTKKSTKKASRKTSVKKASVKKSPVKRKRSVSRSNAKEIEEEVKSNKKRNTRSTRSKGKEEDNNNDVTKTINVTSTGYRSRLRSASISRVPDVRVSAGRSRRSQSRDVSPVSERKKSPVRKTKSPLKKKMTAAERKAAWEAKLAKEQSKQTSEENAKEEAKIRTSVKKQSKKQSKKGNNDTLKSKINKKQELSLAPAEVFDDLAFITPVVSTMLFILSSIWCLLSTFSSMNVLNTSFIPPMISNEYITSILLERSDMFGSSCFFVLTLPLLFTSAAVYHSYKNAFGDSFSSVGQHFSRFFFGVIVLLSYFYLRPYISSSDAYRTGIFTISLSFTISDILVNSCQHDFPTLLQNFMHLMFLAWLVLPGTDHPEMVVQNLYLMHLLSITARTFHAVMDFFQYIQVEFVYKVFLYGYRFTYVVGIPYLGIYFFQSSTIPASIAVFYALTDFFLAVTENYISA